MNYRNAGTAEFLVDQQNRYYFIEINPRIQVEHTITEEITGIDIVAAQIQIAAGASLEQLGLTQDRISTRGFAIQARITTGMPSPACNSSSLPPNRADHQWQRILRRISSPIQARSRFTDLPAVTVSVLMAAMVSRNLCCLFPLWLSRESSCSRAVSRLSTLLPSPLEGNS